MTNQNNIVEQTANEFNLPVHEVQTLADQHNEQTIEFRCAVEELAYFSNPNLNGVNESKVEQILRELSQVKYA